MSNLSRLVGSKLLFGEDEAHGHNDTINIFLRIKRAQVSTKLSPYV